MEMSPKKPRAGPSLVQYLIIIVFVAIIVIVILALLGPAMGTVNSNIRNNL